MSYNKNSFLNLHKSCLLVKGKKRGTINDVQRSKIELVPNELIDFLRKYSTKKIRAIYDSNYNTSELVIIQEYLDFLIKNEFVFLSNERLDFSELPKKFEHPRKLLSAIIDYNSKSVYSLKLAVNKIDNVGCENLQLRLYDTSISPKKLDTILSYFNNTSFRYLEVVLLYESNYVDEFQKIFEKYLRIKLVYYHSYNKDDRVKELNGVNYIFTSEKITSSDYCGYILPYYFHVYPTTAHLGENHNTCLYKKIAIDVDGRVKNCPTMKYDFGDVLTTDFELVISSKKFMKFWDITKDKIKVCKSCEFRKVCTDCRAYLKEDQLYEKPVKCDYTPDNPNW